MLMILHTSAQLCSGQILIFFWIFVPSLDGTSRERDLKMLPAETARVWDFLKQRGRVYLMAADGNGKRERRTPGNGDEGVIAD